MFRSFDIDFLLLHNCSKFEWTEWIELDDWTDMLLTLFYLFQHWKLRSISLDLLSHLSDSIVFYTFVDEGNGSWWYHHFERLFFYAFWLFVASSIVPVSSELCTNQSLARVRNIIWFNESQRGVTLYPKQSIHLAPWITFPSTSHVIPFAFTPNDKQFSDSSLNVYLLIETDVIPSMMIEKNMIMVRQTGRNIVTESLMERLIFAF